jgi:uncharacterized membrane protein
VPAGTQARVVRLPVMTTVGRVTIGVDAAGAACLAVTGWFGGHLVFDHGIGVRRDKESR